MGDKPDNGLDVRHVSLVAAALMGANFSQGARVDAIRASIALIEESARQLAEREAK